MGLDLFIITRKEIKGPDGSFSKHHAVTNRGFSTLLLNATGHPEPVIEELGKVLDMDLSFMYEPEYYDPRSFSEFMDVDENEEPSGWVPIKPYLENLERVKQRISEVPDYESKMKYDRQWWLSYFDQYLQHDIDAVILFLEHALEQGEEDFSLQYS